jgi:hypothetical protein
MYHTALEAYLGCISGSQQTRLDAVKCLLFSQVALAPLAPVSSPARLPVAW